MVLQNQFLINFLQSCSTAASSISLSLPGSRAGRRGPRESTTVTAHCLPHRAPPKPTPTATHATAHHHQGSPAMSSHPAPRASSSRSRRRPRPRSRPRSRAASPSSSQRPRQQWVGSPSSTKQMTFSAPSNALLIDVQAIPDLYHSPYDSPSLTLSPVLSHRAPNTAPAAAKHSKSRESRGSRSPAASRSVSPDQGKKRLRVWSHVGKSIRPQHLASQNEPPTRTRSPGVPPAVAHAQGPTSLPMRGPMCCSSG